MKETFGERFEDCLPTKFLSLMEVLKVVSSSLFTEVKFLTKDFFRARKACRMKIFSSCGANLRADLLLKSSPFSAHAVPQSVIDTVLAELRTADKDPTLAFGKKSFPKTQVGTKGQERKNTSGGGRGKGKGKSSDPKPSTSGQ